MTSALNKMFIFIIGASIGSLVTWKLLEKRYNKMMNEEMRSMKEECNKKIGQTPDPEATVKNESESEEKKDDTIPDADTLKELYRKVLEKSKYSEDKDYGFEMNHYTNMDDISAKPPYVVSPEEFGNADGYDIISLNYYVDGVLADDWNDPIEDIEGTVGRDSLNHFGEYEDDSVFVRNDRLKVEYEILLSSRKFSDVLKETENPSDMEE